VTSFGNVQLGLMYMQVTEQLTDSQPTLPTRSRWDERRGKVQGVLLYAGRMSDLAKH
jgi:hypothetical protein